MQAFNYLFNIGGDFSVKMEGMSEVMGNFNASINATQNGIGKLTQTFATFNLVSDVIGKINNVFSGITEVGANAELQLMNLKTLFGGNAEAAEEMYERISEYGKVTPYDKAGLIEAQRTMMSFGIEGEKAFKTLKQIGDIAMGDKQKMQSLSLAFAQMSSTGKLTGQDLMQMVNAGFNPLQEISKKTGKSVAELKKEMESGAISVGMVEAAFQSATSEGGLFYNAIAEASETTAGKMASIQDTIEEIKVSIFNATGDFGLWISTLTEVMVPISELMPLIMGVGKAMSWVKNLQWASMWSGIKTKIYNAYTTLGMYNGYLSVGKVQNLGFRKNVLQSAVALARFATVGVWNAVKGLGAYILSLVTSGSMSVKFSGIASGAFKAFSLAAKTAIASIPIIGWVALGITAVASLVSYLWNRFDAVGEFLSGMGGRIMSCFLPCLSIIISFKRYWQSIKDAFTEGGIIEGIKRIGFVIIDAILAPWQGFLEMIEGVTGLKIAGKGADWIAGLRERLETSTRVEKKKEEKPKGNGDETEIETPETPEENNPTGSTLGTVGSNSESSGKVRSITVNVEKLVERFEIHTTNLQGDMSRVKDMVSEALLSALNDVNLAM